MLERLKQHIDKNLPFLKGKKLLIACSGGLDSVVMTYLFKDMGFDIGLAHCNFSLRGSESDGDEAFVTDLAEKLNIPSYVETFDTREYADTRKLSIQMAARELRYLWFDEILRDFHCDFLLTAHHADDNLETLFINLSRGTGLRGLTGIPEQSDNLVRPLLPFSRDEILKYAKEERYFWREDSSNKEIDYLRNAIHHDVIPPLKRHIPKLLKSLEKTQGHLRESQSLLEDYLVLIRQLVMVEQEDGYSINISKISNLPNTEALLYELLRPFGFTAWKDISELIHAQSGKFIVSASHRLVKDRDLLLLTEIPLEDNAEETEILRTTKRIEHPIPLIISSVVTKGVNTDKEIFVDANTLTYPLKVRRWRGGDYFYPIGMQGKKKLSKYFKDEKLSLVAKEKIWLLCSGEQIVWIIGHRADDRYKVGPETTQIKRIHTS
ncbi:MAG: tRNA lysidine(34) synthetase TilS [Flavobacteriaceae bacterium]|nr:tRNA lysidine(34) synthetase TilS [Flavobacteriaceae bacterium]NNM08317.1 tRNA lysidine(34) synthetase TilS [Flavobacteriaceae bacterium]